MSIEHPLPPGTPRQGRTATVNGRPPNQFQTGSLQPKAGEHQTWPPVYRPLPQNAAGSAPLNVTQRKQSLIASPVGTRRIQPPVAQARSAGNPGQRQDSRIWPPVYKPKSMSTAQPQTHAMMTPGRTKRPLTPPLLTTAVATSRSSPVLQRSIWDCFGCCPGTSKKEKDSTELVQAPLLESEKTERTGLLAKEEPTGNKYSFREGKGGLVAPGDTVDGYDITSCGMVIGYGSEGIAVYHWPFMTNSTENHEKFNSLVAQIGTLKKIEVYTNKVPEAHEKDYEYSTEVIQLKHRKRTVHYVTDSFSGNVWLLLGENGAKVLRRSVTQWRSFPN